MFAARNVEDAGVLLKKIDRFLGRRYGLPRLGNKRHPVSELVFIILSARTRGTRHEETYRDLRRSYPTWEAVRDADQECLAELIRDAGLSRIKARQIKGLLTRLSDDFGTLNGRCLRKLPTAELELYLTALPGVGLKTARCMLMYSLDRDVFPVDTHCLRLLQNLGLVEGRMRLEEAQEPLQSLVPPAIRRSLHVHAVVHGRRTCLPVAPRCNVCPIEKYCTKSRVRSAAARRVGER